MSLGRFIIAAGAATVARGAGAAATGAGAAALAESFPTAAPCAASDDGIHWKYLGTCQGDHDLTDPLAAKGAGPEPGVTWWAPCFLQQGHVLHMWVVLVDGIYTNWTGKRNILHFTSDDGINWNPPTGEL